MTERLHLWVSGRVQGVGFRWATQAKALELGLNGWVRNLPDGCVEAEFEGAPAALDAMESWCWQGPRMALVDSVKAARESGPPKHTGFRVTG
jgi:acylphosphatase